jgi:ribosome-binding factor A
MRTLKFKPIYMNTKSSPSSNKEKKQSAVKQLSGLLKNKISEKTDWKKAKTLHLKTKYGL